MEKFSLEYLLEAAEIDLARIKKGGIAPGSKKGEFFYTTIDEIIAMESRIVKIKELLYKKQSFTGTLSMKLLYCKDEKAALSAVAEYFKANGFISLAKQIREL